MRNELAVLLLLLAFINTTAAEASSPWWKRILSHKSKENDDNMGSAVRVMRYDRAGNEAAALSALEILGQKLNWFRLDDGVMGGQSETTQSAIPAEGGDLHFAGTINTDGGGFCSIRAKLQEGFSSDLRGIRLRFIGDGKTYKLTLSDGNTGGPFGRSPSWQVDVPTEAGDTEQTVVFPISDLKPAFGGRQSSKPSAEDMAKYQFDPTSMREIGLMLSLRLSDGSPNPKATYGEGIFPFSLRIKSIEPVTADSEASK